MHITVLGTGYVGLVAGACFAESGNDVVCVDKDATKIRMLRRGTMPVFEPGLEELVRRNQQEERLSFTTKLSQAVRRAEVVFIAVGTPQGEDGSADLSHVLAVAEEIGSALNGYKVIVDKSTVPVGTATKVGDVIRSRTSHDFSVVSNPEFLKQGAALDDFLKPDRVVIGTEDVRAAEIMKQLYEPFTRTGAPIMMMDCESAELSKYAANAMLATRISFMNEIANVCEAVGADVDEVRRAIGADSRIGSSFLFPGIGYGGSCFPKDVKAIIHFAGQRDYQCRILQAVEAVNASQKTRLLTKLRDHFGALKGKQIAVWGLAFKPRTDDMREAPSIPLIRELLAAGAAVHAYDPEAAKNAQRILGDRVEYAPNNYDVLKGVDALAIVTEWPEFRRPDFERMRELMRSPVIFDGRNLFTAGQMKQHGFTYYSIGRPAPQAVNRGYPRHEDALSDILRVEPTRHITAKEA